MTQKFYSSLLAHFTLYTVWQSLVEFCSTNSVCKTWQ